MGREGAYQTGPRIADKVCPRCSVRKPRDEFPYGAALRGGGRTTSSYCRPCSHKYNYERRRKDPERLAQHRKNERAQWNAKTPEERFFHRVGKRSTLGLTQEVFYAMYEAQGGSCPICTEKLDLDFGAGQFAVDHCHRTGSIRGILCQLCNRGLGHFRDRPEVLELAANYLRARNQ